MLRLCKVKTQLTNRASLNARVALNTYSNGSFDRLSGEGSFFYAGTAEVLTLKWHNAALRKKIVKISQKTLAISYYSY